MKLQKNFYLQEFVSKEFYRKFGDFSIRYLHPKLPELAQFFRDRFKKGVTINNWVNGGLYNYSGLRPPHSRIGARFSRHKLGIAMDIKINGLNALELQSEIKKNFQKIYKPLGLTAIEDGTKTWTHVSLEWTQSKTLALIPIPKK